MRPASAALACQNTSRHREVQNTRRPPSRAPRHPVSQSATRYGNVETSIPCHSLYWTAPARAVAERGTRCISGCSPQGRARGAGCAHAYVPCTCRVRAVCRRQCRASRSSPGLITAPASIDRSPGRACGTKHNAVPLRALPWRRPSPSPPSPLSMRERRRGLSNVFRCGLPHPNFRAQLRANFMARQIEAHLLCTARCGPHGHGGPHAAFVALIWRQCSRLFQPRAPQSGTL